MTSGRAAALALVLAAGCGGGAEPEPAAGAPPEEAALRVGGVPITPAEIARAAERVQLPYPARAESWARRTALGSFLIPRAAVAARWSEERAAALDACRAAGEALARDGAPPPDARVVRSEGGWGELGLRLWDEARLLEDGAWSGCVEEIGELVRVRLDRRLPSGAHPAEERLAVTMARFRFAPELGQEDLAALLGETRLEVLDPDAARDVPERLQYAMGAR